MDVVLAAVVVREEAVNERLAELPSDAARAAFWPKVSIVELRTRVTGMAPTSTSSRALLAKLSQERTYLWYAVLMWCKAWVTWNLHRARSAGGTPVDTRLWELLLFMSHRLEQLQDVLVDADGPAEQAPPVAPTDASAATGGGPSSRVATPVPAPGFVSSVGGLGVIVRDRPPDRTPRVRVDALVCRYPVALQWRDLSGFAWPKVSSGRREMAMRDRLAALAATPRRTEKGAAHTAAVAGALRRWQVMVSYIQTRPDEGQAGIDKVRRAAAKKQSKHLLPMPGTGKGIKRKAADMDADGDDQGDGLVPRDRGAPASATAAGSAAGGAVPELLDDPLDPVSGPLSTLDERVWLVLQLMADVREGKAHPDGDDDGDGTTRGRGTGQTLSAKKQKRLSASAKGKSVAGAAASKTPGAVVERDVRTVRVSYAAMIVNRSWDVVAAKCGYADAMTMFWPYLVWCAEECKLKPLLHPSDGFSPRCQRYRLFHGLPTSMDPDVVDPVALATFTNSPDDDRLLRKAAAQYERHMSDVLGSPELWSATYEPLSRQTDRGKVSVCSFLPHESALVGGVVPVLVPSLRELWLDDEAPAKLADGAPSSDILDAVADGRPFSAVSVADVRLIEGALAARVHMVSCNFWQFPTANLKNKIQLAYLDPPYGTRLERGEPNSAHDRLSERDMLAVARDVTGMVRHGGQLIIQCSDLQFPKWHAILSNLRTATALKGRSEPEWSVDPCSMVSVSSNGGGGGRSSTTLANWVDKAIHATRKGGGAGTHRMVSYKNHNHTSSPLPAHCNAITNVAPPGPLEIVYNEDGKWLRPEQKSVGCVRELVSRFSHPGDSVLDLFMGTGTTAVACVQTRRTFYGCDVDDVVVKAARRRTYFAFVDWAKANQGAGGVTPQLLDAVQRVAAELAARRPQPSSSTKWLLSALTLKAGEPAHTRVPTHIVHFLVSLATTVANDFFTVKGLDDLLVQPVHDWPQQMRAVFECADTATVRAADATACRVRVASSGVPFGGLGVFVSHPGGLRVGDQVGSMWGGLVFKDLRLKTLQDHPHRPYGTMRGTARITHQTFSRNAHLVPLKARRGAPPPPKVWLVPSVGCACGYINHYGAVSGAEKVNFQADGSTLSRKPNVHLRLRPLKCPSDMVHPDLLTVVATADVAFGEELFLDYGADFDWGRVNAMLAASSGTTPQSA